MSRPVRRLRRYASHHMQAMRKTNPVTTITPAECLTSLCSQMHLHCPAMRQKCIEKAGIAERHNTMQGLWIPKQTSLRRQTAEGMLTSKPEVRFIPKNEAGTVDIMRAKDATATSSSTRIILFRMVSSCMAQISRVLFMFSTISCASASLLDAVNVPLVCHSHAEHAMLIKSMVKRSLLPYICQINACDTIVSRFASRCSSCHHFVLLQFAACPSKAVSLLHS